MNPQTIAIILKVLNAIFTALSQVQKDLAEGKEIK
jgi:hypothetical protein